MLLIDHTWYTVALNYTLNRQDGMKSTNQLASVRLAQARPNNSKHYIQ